MTIEMLREALKRRTDYGSILAAREPGSRYWHRWDDCADERQEEESPVTESSCVRVIVRLEGGLRWGAMNG